MSASLGTKAAAAVDCEAVLSESETALQKGFEPLFKKEPLRLEGFFATRPWLVSPKGFLVLARMEQPAPSELTGGQWKLGPRSTYLFSLLESRLVARAKSVRPILESFERQGLDGIPEYRGPEPTEQLRLDHAHRGMHQSAMYRLRSSKQNLLFKELGVRYVESMMADPEPVSRTQVRNMQEITIAYALGEMGIAPKFHGYYWSGNRLAFGMEYVAGEYLRFAEGSKTYRPETELLLDAYVRALSAAGIVIHDLQVIVRLDGVPFLIDFTWYKGQQPGSSVRRSNWNELNRTFGRYFEHPVLDQAKRMEYQQMKSEERYAMYAKLFSRMQKGESATEVENVIPGFSDKLEIARSVSDRFWSRSVNYDELVQAEILPQPVLRALGIEQSGAGREASVSAGVMHTYGYLLSQLPTQYGLKGKRWIESRIDERLGLPAGSFSPHARNSEFLSNVTFILNRLVAPKAEAEDVWRAMHENVTREFFKEFGYLDRMKSELHEGYVEDQVGWRTPEGKTIRADVRTHLVRLRELSDLASQDTHLLIYEVHFEGQGRKLVTAFPVEREFADSIRSSSEVVDSSFEPRFNLYIDPAWQVVSHARSSFQSSQPSAQTP